MKYDLMLRDLHMPADALQKFPGASKCCPRVRIAESPVNAFESDS